MAKYSAKVLQYCCYQDELNSVRKALFYLRISQYDFARYLRIDEKLLSLILNGKSVPNAAFWSYIRYILTHDSVLRVLMRYLEKNGKSSLSRYRNRSFVVLHFPLPF